MLEGTMAKCGFEGGHAMLGVSAAAALILKGIISGNDQPMDINSFTKERF